MGRTGKGRDSADSAFAEPFKSTIGRQLEAYSERQDDEEQRSDVEFLDGRQKAEQQEDACQQRLLLSPALRDWRAANRRPRRAAKTTADIPIRWS